MDGITEGYLLMTAVIIGLPSKSRGHYLNPVIIKSRSLTLEKPRSLLEIQHFFCILPSEMLENRGHYLTPVIIKSRLSLALLMCRKYLMHNRFFFTKPTPPIGLAPIYHGLN